jgi:hypothetical protein
MDQNTCLENIKRCLLDSEWYEAIEYIDAMNQWLARGGHPPGGYTRLAIGEYMTQWHRVATAMIHAAEASAAETN